MIGRDDFDFLMAKPAGAAAEKQRRSTAYRYRIWQTKVHSPNVRRLKHGG